MSCCVGHRRGSDPVLLWLWWRPAPTALIPPLAWEHPHAVGSALEKTKQKKKKKRETEKERNERIGYTTQRRKRCTMLFLKDI